MAARRVSAVSVVSGLFIGTVHLFTSILVPTCWSVYRAFDRSSRNACFLRAMDFYAREVTPLAATRSVMAAVVAVTSAA